MNRTGRDPEGSVLDPFAADNALDSFFAEVPAPERTALRRFATMGSYSIRDAVRGIRRRPGLAASVAVTVALCSLLAGGASVARAGIDDTLARWSDGVEFVVYLQPGSTAEEVRRVGDGLASTGGVRSVDHVTQDEAYTEYLELYSEERAMVEAVTPDLLPASFRVTPERADPDLIRSITDPLSSDAAVYQVVTADDAVRDVRDVSGAVSGVGTWLAVALGGVGVALSAAMIRSSIVSRRQEIDVMRRVGAGRTFIAAPVVAEGVMVGAISAGLAVGVLAVVLSRAGGSSSAVVAALLPSSGAVGTVMVQMIVATVAVCSGVSVLAAASALRTSR